MLKGGLEPHFSPSPLPEFPIKGEASIQPTIQYNKTLQIEQPNNGPDQTKVKLIRVSSRSAFTSPTPQSETE